MGQMMRRHGGVGAAVAGIAATGTAVGLLTTALFTGTTLTAPPAAATADLQPFSSCTALRDWYVDHSIRQVGPYGWNGPAMFGRQLGYRITELRALVATAGLTGSAAVRSSVDDPVGNSATGTNTQETGVDEPDVAKTDGKIVVRVVDRRVVISDVTGARPRTISTYSLPRPTGAANLLLAGDRIVVVTDQWARIKLPAYDDGGRSPGRSILPTTSSTRVIDLDISTPATPKVVSDDSYSGSQISVRQYGDVVRLATSTGKPQLAFVQPHRGLNNRAATARNKALVRASAISDWLPSVRNNLTHGPATPLIDCTRVFHSSRFTGTGTDTIAVIGFTAGEPGTRDTTAVTATGDLVYSSTNHLYVATTRYPMTYWGGPARVIGAAFRPTGTDVHAFDLTGIGATYSSSAHLAGTLRDRWSMDEYDGQLRVAVSWQGRRGRPSDNGIVVLTRDGTNLVRTGIVRGLGNDEEIQSVRWFDDLAILVTFRQMDPLYTVDLSNPAAPTMIGALKIPGFSSYLHPIGNGRLLGIGTSATRSGVSLGGQAAVFDISELKAPRRLSVLGFGRDTGVTAADDPRAFTWLPDRDTALTGVEDWRDGSTRIELLSVSSSGMLTARVVGRDNSGLTRALPLADRRVALVGRGLRILDLG